MNIFSLQEVCPVIHFVCSFLLCSWNEQFVTTRKALGDISKRWFVQGDVLYTILFILTSLNMTDFQVKLQLCLCVLYLFFFCYNGSLIILLLNQYIFQSESTLKHVKKFEVVVTWLFQVLNFVLNIIILLVDILKRSR